jgi:endonuclease/exonuclease/phosphatase (EEP) superfamily protein YafD
LVVVAAIATGLAFILGELGRYDWRLELLSHFAVQYIVVLAAACVSFLIRGRGLLFVLAAAMVLMPAWRLAAYVPVWATPTHATAATHRLRVMTINVHASNTRYDDVRAEIERLDPDIVFLSESTDLWVAGLAPLRGRYPHVIDGRSASVFSLRLFSRLPLPDASIIRLPELGGDPAIVARACMEGADNDMACVRLIGIHPPPPMTATWAARRDAVLGAVPALIAGADAHRTVLLGDFNCTPWSPLFRDLVTETGLRSTAVGLGVSPTWFSHWPPLGLTIDHILIGAAIDAQSHEVGDDVGSDHFPVVADLVF